MCCAAFSWQVHIQQLVWGFMLAAAAADYYFFRLPLHLLRFVREYSEKLPRVKFAEAVMTMTAFIFEFMSLMVENSHLDPGNLTSTLFLTILPAIEESLVVAIFRTTT